MTTASRSSRSSPPPCSYQPSSYELSVGEVRLSSRRLSIGVIRHKTRGNVGTSNSWVTRMVVRRAPGTDLFNNMMYLCTYIPWKVRTYDVAVGRMYAKLFVVRA